MSEQRQILKCRVLTEKEKQYDFEKAEVGWAEGRVDVSEIAVWVAFEGGYTEIMTRGGASFVIDVPIALIDKMKCDGN